MFADHNAAFNYYQKDAKKNLFPHFHSSMPQSQKTANVTNKYQRMITKYSTQSDTLTKFLDTRCTKAVTVISFDLRKVFGTVSHNLLLQKLSHFIPLNILL